MDVDQDDGSHCFVTGNDNNFNFVYDGIVTLISPVFDLSGAVDPYLSYYTWFANFHQGGAGDDTMRVFLTSNSDTLLLEEIWQIDTLQPQWTKSDYKLDGMIELSDSMHLIFEAIANSHPQGEEQLLEAGVDLFMVADSADTVGTYITPVLQDHDQFEVYPNPFFDNTRVTYAINDRSAVSLEIFNILGTKLYTVVKEIQEPGVYNYLVNKNNIKELPGVYLLYLTINDQRQVRKIISTQ
ncbi:MAG: T9SS type A sorting domain-containing protein [Bacteroidetes bacterium]|nr:T9SS type A sorting domain-containing protein [Bacteroidota bacterium]